MAQVSHGPHYDPTTQALSGSITNSQESSFAESLTSLPSQMRPSSAGRLEASQPDANIDAVTPSTPLSNFSSQEYTTDGRLPAEKTGKQHMEPSITGASRRNLLVQTDGLEDRPSGAQPVAFKRTANGEIKSPQEILSASLPESPAESRAYGHSRTTSATSKSSHIGELSYELRTRLSYAMVKVRRGWENQNLSELESRKSSRFSPVSTTPSLNPRGLDLSTVKESPTSRPTSAYTLGEIPPYLRTSPRSRAHKRSHSGNYTSAPSSAISAPNQPNEHFWQDRSSPRSHAISYQNVSQAPSLGPPVDILPRNAQPQQLSHQFHHKQQAPSASTNTNPSNPNSYPIQIPTTPPPHPKPKRIPLAKMRTPSQQAAVEKDAVETLLFMSSPGNSQHYPSQGGGASQNLTYNYNNSPLGTSFMPSSLVNTPTTTTTTTTTQPLHGLPDLIPLASPSRTTALSLHHSLGTIAPVSHAGGGNSTFGRPHAFDTRHQQRSPLSDRDIDKMLDEMADSDDDSSQGSSSSV